MNICVYGASSDDIRENYFTVCNRLGKLMGKHGHGLVFGAGGHGLMGATARGVKAENGNIIGIVPRFFDVGDILYKECSELIFTDTMRERKQLMEDKSDAFITTPGGIGTYEEFFEILTLKQLGRHNKPIVVLNIDGYYDSLGALLQKTAEEGFMSQKCRDIVYFCKNEEEAIGYIEAYDPEKTDVRHLKNL